MEKLAHDQATALNLAEHRESTYCLSVAARLAEDSTAYGISITSNSLPSRNSMPSWIYWLRWHGLRRTVSNVGCDVRASPAADGMNLAHGNTNDTAGGSRLRRGESLTILRMPRTMLVPPPLARALPPLAKGSVRRERSIRKPIVVALVSIVIGLAGAGSRPANAENPDISSRRASARTDFTNEEIKDGFFKIAFNAELQLGAPVERVRKFDEPVRIFVVSKGVPDRRSEIAAIIADIQARVNHLDVAITNDRQAANFVVTLVAQRDFARTIRALYGSDKARRIQQSLNPQCLSGIGKDTRYRIRRAEVILPVDAGEFTFYDCAYEELLQALGAINDDRSVPWTMFNDDVQMGFFDVYDQYLLNILYDPRIRPRMSKEEVSGLLPDVLPAARAWVTNANSPRHADGRNGPGANPTRAATAALLRSMNVQTSRGAGAN
jgi:hypothetical protein